MEERCTKGLERVDKALWESVGQLLLQYLHFEFRAYAGGLQHSLR
jgi:hypothetical protein